MSEKVAIFAVVGNPVLHSLSPVIFNSVFLSEERDAVYIRILAEKAEEAIEIIKQINLNGVNVTSPFKEAILKYLHVIDDEAKKIGAVNTVKNVDGILEGYNTDVKGIEGIFKKRRFQAFYKKAIVIGAGGAARAACFLLKQRGLDVTIINRTYKNAIKIAKAIGVKAIPIEHLNGKIHDADIIIQCLPRDINLISPHSIKRGALVIDANYSIDSLIVKGAKEANYVACDGRDWLLHQAIASYKVFTNEFPPLHIMERALKKRPLDENKRKNISLVGFMGAGKSTVGKYLSEYTGFEFLEIDSLIEKSAGMTVQEIFKSRGERFFRDVEQEEIEKIGGLSKKVISCGGGCVISEKNREILKRHSIVIWLWARPETVFKRIYRDNSRPLAENIEDINALKSFLKKRISLYADAADLIMYVEDKKPENIARSIYEETKRFIRD